MPGIARAIIGLSLAAQHRLHHQRALGIVGHVLQYAVKQPRRNHLPQRQRFAECGQIVFQRNQLFAARRLMNPVNHRRDFGLKRLGRRYIGCDHKVFDHAVRIKPFAQRDLGNSARRIEHNAPFWQFERQGITVISGLFKQLPRRPQVEQMRRGLASIDAPLRFFVGEHFRYPHQCARKAPAGDPPARIDGEMASHRRTVCAYFERTDVCAQHFGQHRHNAVGEIG